jgi:hypothetical protein
MMQKTDTKHVSPFIINQSIIPKKMGSHHISPISCWFIDNDSIPLYGCHAPRWNVYYQYLQHVGGSCDLSWFALLKYSLIQI